MSNILEHLSRLNPKSQSLEMPTDPSHGGLTWEIITGALSQVEHPGRLILEIKYVGQIKELDGLVQMTFDHIREEFPGHQSSVLKRVVKVSTNEHVRNLPCKKCKGRAHIIKRAEWFTCTKCGGSGKAIHHASDKRESSRRRAALCGLSKDSFNRHWRELYHSTIAYLEESESWATYQFKKAMRVE